MALLVGGDCRPYMETWKAAALTIGVDIAERIAYAGISGNLMTFFSQALHENTATSARNVNIWTGIAMILPFFGAFVADSYFGRYKTILWSSLVYLLGLLLISISALLNYSSFKACMFFFAIYLVAMGQGGFKPCLQAFGADQFIHESSQEDNNSGKSSFFIWWYFGVCLGNLFGLSVLIYVEEYVGWDVGFAIPVVFMALAFMGFASGTPIYVQKPPGGSAITNIVHVFVATYHKRNIETAHSNHNTNLPQEPLLRKKLEIKFRFLDKATIGDELDDEFEFVDNWRLCTMEQVNEVKNILSLCPIWVALLNFGIVFAQSSTFFTKQGNTMRKNIGWFEIPAAALQSLILLVILLLIPIYDKVFVPLVRKLTGNESGISILQRIGTGLIISAISMVVSALIEIKRISTTREHGLVDTPEATIPLSIIWLLPQYVLFGIADVFTMVGMQEFFYEEMPDRMKSLGIAIYLSVIGVGSILSGLLISALQHFSCKYKAGCWISSNLNKGHLDSYYWLLASLSTLNFCFFMILASSYQYRRIRELNVVHQALQP